jgi:hypothetical protein
VSARRKYVLFRGVVSVTPLSTTKNMNVIAAPIRIKDVKPITLPVNDKG